MCYKHPGPRCTNHARKTLVKADTALRGFRMYDRNVARDGDEYMVLKQRADQAQQDFDATPGGQADLRRQIAEGRDTNGELAMRLELGIARRKEMLAAVKSVDKGDFHDDPVVYATEELDKLPSTFLADDQVRPMWANASNIHELEAAHVEESARWMANLTPEQQEAVRWYTSNGAHVMNCHILGEKDEIFGGKYSKKKITESIKALDAAFDQYQSDTPRVVYRGLQEWNFPQEIQDLQYQPGFEDALDAHLAEKFKPGSTFVSPVHMSASLDPHMGASFEKMDVMMEIATKKAPPVSAVSAWGISEREALVSRKAKFRVVGVKKNVPYEAKNWRTKESEPRQMTVIQLEEIS